MENFKFLFRSSDIWLIIRNTLGYNLVFLAGGPVLGILVAVFLNEVEQRSPARIYQTVILLPYLISITVITYLAYAFLSNENGMLNKFVLPLLGKRSGAVVWRGKILAGNPDLYQFLEIFRFFQCDLSGKYCRHQYGILRGGLSGWSQQMETVYDDYAASFETDDYYTDYYWTGQECFRSDFGLFYQVPLNNGALFKATQTIDTYVFRGLTSASNLGLSAAAGFLQSFIGFLTVMTANMVIRKISESDALLSKEGVIKLRARRSKRENGLPDLWPI